MKMSRKLFLMKCGHVNNAVDSNGQPCCVICAGITPGAEIVDKEIIEDTDGLEGRIAKCSDCSSTTASSWTLPFFEYCPDKDHDSYYCGCYGWD